MSLKRKIFFGLIIVLILLQFYRPSKNQSATNPVATFETATQMQPQLASVFQQYCYDCHSDHTVYPWYSEISPVSLWINNHVVEGKEHLNLSDWQNWDKDKKDHKLEEIIEEVKSGHMPEKPYTWIHGSPSEEEKKQVMDWASKTREALK